MTASELIDELRPLGLESYRRVIFKHGVVEPCFGVKIEELKKYQKKIKKDYQLALDLFATEIYDAMYLAGLIADDQKMTKADLDRWANGSNCPPISESTVAWVAAEGRFGPVMADKWIESKKELVASSGWSTWSCLTALTPDDRLDLDRLRALLSRVATTLHDQPNRVRYTMNGFVIAVGGYVGALKNEAIAVAEKVGRVHVEMGQTACKVPEAIAYIAKMTPGGAPAKKRKTVKC